MLKKALLASALAFVTVSGANAYAVVAPEHAFVVPEHHAHQPVVRRYPHHYVPPSYYYHNYRHLNNGRVIVR